MKKGDYIHYSPQFGSKENGRIKSINKNYAFVVYKCDGNWDEYEKYTGQSTNLEDLRKGWVDENGKILPEYCDHEYLYTNSKWQPINQKVCMHCDHTIN